MLNQDSGLVIRPAVSGDRWKIYKQTRLPYLDCTLGFNIFLLIEPTRELLEVIELALNGLFEYLTDYSDVVNLFAWLVFASVFTYGLSVRARLAKIYHWSNTWVAEKRNRLIAIACVQRKGSYSILNRLSVNFQNRRRGIGSQLVQTIIEQTPKPIYLICKPSIVRFYARFGFAQISHRDAPREFRYLFSYTVLVLR